MKKVKYKMSFYEEYLKHKNFDLESFFESITEDDIFRIINSRKLDEYDFLALLSPTAERCLEEMAEKAYELTLKNFGKAVLLYTPMYLGNYCTNKCVYCGFNHDNDIVRKKLTMEEIEIEAKKIYDTGLRHIIILTGSSRKETPVSYIADSVKLLKKYFDSIAIEVYSLTEGSICKWLKLEWTVCLYIKKYMTKKYMIKFILQDLKRIINLDWMHRRELVELK
jgi:2-iminoacetate synthase